MKRVDALNDHPIFIEALANIVVEHFKKNELTTTQLKLRCSHCVNPYCEEMRQFFTNKPNKHQKTVVQSIRL